MTPAGIAAIVQALAVIIGGGVAIYKYGTRHGEDQNEARAQTRLLKGIQDEVKALSKTLDTRSEDFEERLHVLERRP